MHTYTSPYRTGIPHTAHSCSSISCSCPSHHHNTPPPKQEKNAAFHTTILLQARQYNAKAHGSQTEQKIQERRRRKEKEVSMLSPPARKQVLFDKEKQNTTLSSRLTSLVHTQWANHPPIHFPLLKTCPRPLFLFLSSKQPSSYPPSHPGTASSQRRAPHSSL